MARGRGMEAFVLGSERKHKEAPWTSSCSFRRTPGEELGRLEHKIEQGGAAAWAARGWARTTREVVGGYMVEAERNLDWGLGHLERGGGRALVG